MIFEIKISRLYFIGKGFKANCFSAFIPFLKKGFDFFFGPGRQLKTLLIW